MLKDHHNIETLASFLENFPQNFLLDDGKLALHQRKVGGRPVRHQGRMGV